MTPLQDPSGSSREVLSIANNPQPVSVPRKVEDWQNGRAYFRYHCEQLSHIHYIRPFDLRNGCIGGLRQLAEEYDFLYHAVVAFSALIYAIPEPRAQDHAHWFYGKAIRQLHQATAMEVDARHRSAILATMLQLSTFEVPLLVPESIDKSATAGGSRRAWSM
jgi:hypothetical protein